MDRKKIQLQAKEIMDEFSKALDKVKLDEDVGIERDAQTREAKAAASDKLFIKRFLANAPKTKDSYVVAEKKKW